MSTTTVTITPGLTVGKVAHGLMMMTSIRAEPIPDEQCFESIKTGIDSLPTGAKMFFNSAEFYGPNLGPANLEMLSRFFEMYPEYIDRAFLSVKGGTNKGTLEFNSSPENIRRSVDTCIAALRSKKRIDLFECARVDPKVPIEETMETLKTLVSEGKFDCIGLSECSATTLQRAAKVAPIVAVEIEISPVSYEEETKKVIATAKELNIAVVGYSPVGRGLLSMAVTSANDLPTGDLRGQMTRFKGENLSHNAKIAHALKEIANERGVTPAQLAIAWVAALGSHVIPLPGSSAASRTHENCAAGNIALSEAEVQRITRVVDEHGVVGDRYFGGPPEVMHLWG